MLDTLRSHPQIGMVSSFGSAFLGWVDILTPVATFISICIGIAIGLVTLGLKYKEWRNK
tara:strand:- start:1122 stop:1298 length:177 start_codon:yes stop_codon:yes gene_type:complete